MRILPREQREAMFEIYAFCRAVDDIADDPGPRQERLAALETWRSDLATLDVYCDRVACAVGRLSVRVFGMPREAGLALAHHLGRALQLTNILRDLDEDAAMGRLYLPREALRDAGIISTDPHTVLAHPLLEQPCNVIVALAIGEFEAADGIMAHEPRRTVRAPRIMGQAYRLILDRLIARGFEPPRAPVRLPRAKILLIVLRNFI